MKIFKKQIKDIINSKQDMIIFPTSLYDCGEDEKSTLFSIYKNNPRPLRLLKKAINNRNIDLGSFFCCSLIDDLSIGVLISTYRLDYKVDYDENRNIDYELLYTSLKELRNTCVIDNIKKVGFCISDFKILNCNLDILESMIRSIFSKYDLTITFIYGE